MTTQPKLVRKFKIGSALIDFPNPLGDLQDNIRLAAQNFPQVRWTHVFEEDGVFENGSLVFPVVIPPVKTNG